MVHFPFPFYIVGIGSLNDPDRSYHHLCHFLISRQVTWLLSIWDDGDREGQKEKHMARRRRMLTEWIPVPRERNEIPTVGGVHSAPLVW